MSKRHNGSRAESTPALQRAAHAGLKRADTLQDPPRERKKGGEEGFFFFFARAEAPTGRGGDRGRGAGRGGGGDTQNGVRGTVL